MTATHWKGAKLTYKLGLDGAKQVANFMYSERELTELCQFGKSLTNTDKAQQAQYSGTLKILK